MKPIPTLSDEDLSLELQRALRELPDAPAALQRVAIDLWTAPPASLGAVVQAGLRLVHALLSFDSWAAGATAQGLRSLRSPTRHLLFNAEGRDVDLRISRATEAYSLAGQVLGRDEAGSVEPLRLDLAEARPQTAGLDALGEFRIDALSPGIYQLTLQLGTDAVLLPPLEVGEAAEASAA